MHCAAQTRALWLRPGAYTLIAVDEADRVIDHATLHARPHMLLPRGTPASAYRPMQCHPLMQVFKIRH